MQNTPNILLIGKNGQLGFELCRLLSPLSNLTAVDVEECNLADPSSIRSTIRAAKPGLILNASAYTDVEKAEVETDLAFAINGSSLQIMADQARSAGAGIVHYSTDYVFDGKKPSPYVEVDLPNPLSAYGRSKLDGESVLRTSGIPHLILRTSWLYGERGRNFLLTILSLAKSRDRLSVVSDQIGAPTWCRSLAETTLLMLQKLEWKLPTPGKTYHVTSGGSTSWFGFAKQALALSSDPKLRCVDVIPIPTSEYPTKAKRPLNSLLSNESLAADFGISMPPWDEELKRVMEAVEGSKDARGRIEQEDVTR